MVERFGCVLGTVLLLACGGAVETGGAADRGGEPLVDGATPPPVGSGGAGGAIADDGVLHTDEWCGAGICVGEHMFQPMQQRSYNGGPCTSHGASYAHCFGSSCENVGPQVACGAGTVCVNPPLDAGAWPPVTGCVAADAGDAPVDPSQFVFVDYWCGTVPGQCIDAYTFQPTWTHYYEDEPCTTAIGSYPHCRGAICENQGSPVACTAGSVCTIWPGDGDSGPYAQAGCVRTDGGAAGPSVDAGGE
jgi:hypothetical protein